MTLERRREINARAAWLAGWTEVEHDWSDTGIGPGWANPQGSNIHRNPPDYEHSLDAIRRDLLPLVKNHRQRERIATLLMAAANWAEYPCFHILAAPAEVILRVVVETLEAADG